MNRIALAGLVSAGCLFALVRPAQSAEGSNAATLVSKDNRVEVAVASGGWSAASAGQALHIGDRLKTGEESRANVRMADGSVLQLDELTTIEIKPPKVANTTATLSVPSGAAYFFNQGGSREVSVETPSANGAIRGTAFLLTVNRSTGQTGVAMIEGAFELSSGGGNVTAKQGEQAQAGSGGGPAKNKLGDNGNTGPWYLVIENQLPSIKTLHSVGKAQFLQALPSAIKQFGQVAPQLSGGATLTRREWALDILREAFNAAGGDCGMKARILKSVIAAAPEQAAALTEAAISASPDCAGSFGGGSGSGGGEEGGDGFGPPPTLNNTIMPGSIGGGGGQGNLIAICHNGQTIFLTPEAAEEQLRNNPGDTVGACQVTPSQNR